MTTQAFKSAAESNRDDFAFAHAFSDLRDSGIAKYGEGLNLFRCLTAISNSDIVLYQPKLLQNKLELSEHKYDGRADKGDLEAWIKSKS